ncbi:hypothetical protein [Nocardia veterana]|uniref:Condensation domain-containing protein n=1 Tax=Nocardia veterana TaxID=132249 RepID=A0A7X6M2P9_9NOCA|nr:hypothetical protein [Nocardia veterana]NKY89244.1 hypothetical protein [Nocardia veterana]
MDQCTTAAPPTVLPAEPLSAGAASFTLQFTGYLYAVGLRDAFADLIAHHPALRTVYPMPGSSAAPRVLSPTAAVVPRTVPIPVPATELPAAIRAFMTEEAETSLSLPVRAKLFRPLADPEDAPQHLLVVILRREAVAGVPPAQLAHDLMTAYAARRRNLEPTWEATDPAARLPVHELRGVRLIDTETVSEWPH